VILAEFQSDVLLTCPAVRSSAHPLYTLVYPTSGNEDQSVINRAANKFVGYAVGGNGAGAELFPELQNSWTYGPTYSGTTTNLASTPTDAIAITDVTCAHQATLPDWTQAREFPMNYISPTFFGNLVKDTTVANYASIWTKKGKSVMFWPTVSSSAYADYFRYYGLKRENVLVSSGDTFFMLPIWHDLVATLAAQMLSLKLGWYEQAAALWEQFNKDLTGTLNVTAMEQQPVALGGDGHSFTRTAIYGR
jgi:hypothetical protein